MANYIRFDWAMKRLLRNKANYAVLEGFMTSLLNKPFKIQRFLESESNQLDENDKFNRVDMLVEDDKGELYIFEIQNNRELSYFHRMLYGVSKTIVDYMNLGDEYSRVKKIYSINIVYFELGQGKDYVYHGYTTFQGLHDETDILQLSAFQKTKFLGVVDDEVIKQCGAGVIFPEYYVLRVNDFDSISKTPLDEWISFLKTGAIDESFSAPGLSEARECLNFNSLTEDEKRSYLRHRENIMYQKSVFDTSHYEGLQEGRQEGLAVGRAEGLAEGRLEGIAEGRAEGRAEGIAEGLETGREEGYRAASLSVAKTLKSMGYSFSEIAAVTNLSEDEIAQL